MLNSVPKIAVVYLSYHSEPYLGRFVDALARVNYPHDRLAVVVVDHPHPKFGSSVGAMEELLSRSGKDLPEIILLPQSKNRGFSGGVNIGIAWALEQGFEYIFLHNQDGFLAPNALIALVEAMQLDPTIGAAQSLMMLYPETEKINTAGNSLHYLGFGHVSNGGELVGAARQSVSDIGYASGGAVLLRVDLLRQYGVWDEDYFLYHEDVEYSLRLRSVGYRIVVVPASIFYHQYEFSRNSRKWYFMERNRFGVMVTYYKLPTLLLFLPVGFFVELAILFFAASQGWLIEKLRSYGYWLNPLHWQRWFAKRKKAQLQRMLKDRELLGYTVGELNFSEAGLDNPLLKYIAYPVVNLYLVFLRKIIFW